MVAALTNAGFEDTDFEDTRFRGTGFGSTGFAGTRSGVTGSTRRPRSVTRAEIRRRRTVAAGSALVILFGLFLAVQALLGRPGGGPLPAAGSPGSMSPASAHVWVVHPGDTLWTIALASGARGDIRPLVEKLEAQVGDRPLQPGQRIVLP